MPTDVENLRIAARHEEILTPPQRVAPQPREAVAEQVQAATQKLRGNVLNNAPPLPLELIPEIMFTMVPFAALWDKVIDLTVQIQGPESRLPPRDRKLAILRTGWLCQAPYEFGEHVKQSKRLGFTTEEIERVVTGSSAAEWDDHERAILRAAEELHAGAMVSDATWEQLSRRLDEYQLVELLVLIGQFTATAYFQNTLRIRLEPDNKGLASR